MFFDCKGGITPKVYRHRRIKDRRYLIASGMIISLDSLRHLSLRISDAQKKDPATNEYIPCKRAQIWIYYKHNTLYLMFDERVDEARALAEQIAGHLLTDYELEAAKLGIKVGDGEG